MRTSSRDVALLLFEEVELLDAAAIGQVLSLAGRQWNWRPFRVTPTARRAGRVVTRGQVALHAEVDLAHCPTPEIIVVPGGYGARRLDAEGPEIRWLREVGPKTTHLLAVGAGLGPLAQAGLVSDAPSAGSKDLAEWLAECGATGVDTTRRVVSSEHLITGAKTADAVDAALALVRAILGDKQARAVAEAMGRTERSALDPKAGAPVNIVTPKDS